ncbi:unnamed protein product [Cladocopium goreaui]|uniref:GMP synthase [glutamine-hydrolyzing] n=1 Tax=Cladocopium goreaui TaxID=2562237 RepID=A0A9P1G2P5_9DINO|nr:unnamed protein product [Cladocopium goreaui]
MRLRRLALAMTSAQRKVALSDLSTELKAMLLDFMTTYGKTGVPTEATTPEGSEGAKDAKVFEELDPTLQCPASSSDETSEDSKEEPAVDHLEHLSDVSTVWVAPKTQGEAPDLSLDAHLSDSSSSAPLALEDADGHAGHATPKKKRAYGCTGMRGVSRRIDSKTSRVSYQASVSFENVIFRSKYRHDIQGALDHHIVLMQIRNEVEQAMLDAPQRSFDEICLSACDARASELKEMNAAYCVDMRAFSIKVGSPSSSCLREVLQDRQRMLQARDAGEQAFCEELVSVMTAERENVYKSRPAVSLERAQEVAQKFMEDVRSKRNLREKRLEMIQKQKEDKETRAQERRQRRLERKTMTLQQRWLCATALAERRLTAMTKRRLKQEKREVRAMRLEDTLALRLREHERKARCREEDQRRQKLRKQLRSPASLKDLTFAQQQELGAMVDPGAFRLAYDTENICNYLEEWWRAEGPRMQATPKAAVDMIAGMEKQERILVIDFGSQVSHLICRRVREAGVYCELRSCLLKLDDVTGFHPNGIILSGGPHSVYDKDAPHLSQEIWNYIDEKKLPVFGICYGLQEMCHTLGGKVEPGVKREFGHADLLIREDVAHLSADGSKRIKGRSPIFEGISTEKVPVWMSHGDKVTQLPPGFTSIAYTSNTEFAAVEDQARHIYGVQFHPEVTHTPSGATMIKNFVLKVVGCKGEWNMHDFCQKQIDIIMNKLEDESGDEFGADFLFWQRVVDVGVDKYVVGAVSGGVDSSVAAALVHKAIGDRFRPFMVDTGLLRKDEAKIVKERLEKHIPGMKLKVLDASGDFYKELVRGPGLEGLHGLHAGVEEPEKKRKIIGRLFVEAFEKAVSEMGLPHERCLLLQGTLYPDVIESTSYKGPSSVIKTHHNVGGLPDRMKMEVIEPLRLLFKDEVRALGNELGLPVTSVMRHPFPGPGLGIRIIGEVDSHPCSEVTKESADTLSLADDIYIEELRKNGHYDKIGQAFAVLLPTVRSVGVMGDHRTYENVCVLRAVTTTDFMTADWYDMPHDVLARISNRIINEVKGINRVCYDVSSKPPATIEWE